MESADRILAQTITGVGFIGGGIIMREGDHVCGGTTAATIWCAAAIGMLAGTGDWAMASETAVLVIVVNVGLRRLEAWMKT